MTVALIAGGAVFAAVVALVAVHLAGGKHVTTPVAVPTVTVPQPIQQVPAVTGSAAATIDPSTTTAAAPLSSGVVPPGYTRVTGPVGIQVSVPSDWPTADESLASVDEVDDPDDQNTYLRYGGSASPSMPLMDAVLQIEDSTAALGNDYQRLSLTDVTSPTGDDTVEWQFLFTKNGVQRHAVDWFWRAAGNDYAVYATTSTADWQQLQPTIQVLEQTAGPV
jgi:hypothetical protein